MGGAGIDRRGLDRTGRSAASWAIGCGADFVARSSGAPPLADGRERVAPITLAALVRSANVLDEVDPTLAVDWVLRLVLVLAVFVRMELEPDCGVETVELGRDDRSRYRSSSSSRRLRSVDGADRGVERLWVPRTMRRGRLDAGLSPLNDDEPIDAGRCVGGGNGMDSIASALLH